MIKTGTIKTYLILICSLLIIGSCKKADEPDTNTTSAVDCVNSEDYYSDIKNIMDEAGFKSGAFTGVLSDTAIAVSYDTVNHLDTDTITINFGTNYIQCQDGRNRKGQITVAFTGNYTDTAKTHLISLNNYCVDNNKIYGTIKDAYKGYNSVGHKYFGDTVSGNITYNTNHTLRWTSTSKLTYTEGDSTLAWSDNKMIIEGNASGITSDGDGFSSLISTPLLRNFGDCRKHLTQGVIQIAVSNKPYRATDLGNGTCDDIISVSIDGTVYSAHIN